MITFCSACVNLDLKLSNTVYLNKKSWLFWSKKANECAQIHFCRREAEVDTDFLSYRAENSGFNWSDPVFTEHFSVARRLLSPTNDILTRVCLNMTFFIVYFVCFSEKLSTSVCSVRPLFVQHLCHIYFVSRRLVFVHLLGHFALLYACKCISK